MRARLFSLLVAISVASCGGGVPGGDGGYGTLSIPLTSTGQSGTMYRFTGEFQVERGSDGSLTTIWGGGDTEWVYQELLPDSYLVSVLDGWIIEYQDPADGTWIEIPAVLLSPPQATQIIAGRASVVVFDFGVGDDKVSFGAGRMDVGVNVVDQMITYEFEGHNPTYVWGRISYSPAIPDRNPSPLIGEYPVMPSSGIFELEMWADGNLYYTKTCTGSCVSALIGTGDSYFWFGIGSGYDAIFIESPFWYEFSPGVESGAWFTLAMTANTPLGLGDGLPQTELNYPADWLGTVSWSTAEGYYFTSDIVSFTLVPPAP